MDPVVMLLTVALTVLALAGAVAALVVARRAARPDREGGTDGMGGLVRITATVHPPPAETLVALEGELGLARGATDTGYGELYVEAEDERRLLVRSRSRIGRGFIGAVDLAPARSGSRVTYSILRLPGDEDVNGLVLGLELTIIAALRRIDPDAALRLSADALRNLDGYGRSDRPDRMEEPVGRPDTPTVVLDDQEEPRR